MKKQQTSRPENSKAKRGPAPSTLKINKDWQKAIKESLRKKKPPEGWPK
jgi:hypothetical protein